MELTLLNGLTKNCDLTKEENMLSKLTQNLVQNAATYVLKAMPIQPNVRDVLVDVAGSIGSKDFKTILKTVVTSSIKEGLELIGSPKEAVKDITKVARACFKGGLTEGICAGVDIITNKYLSNNIMGDIVKKYVIDLKNFFRGNEFIRKFDSAMKKLNAKIQKVTSLFKDFFDSLKNFNKSVLNNIFNNIQKLKNNFTTELSKKFIEVTNIITKLNNKKEEDAKLTDIELEACRAIA